MTYVRPLANHGTRSNITGFLHTSTSTHTPTQSDDQFNSTDLGEDYDTGDEVSSDCDAFQSPFSPETPTPTKMPGKKAPKRKRKDKSNRGK